jgi:gliding motility-associated-like protein
VPTIIDTFHVIITTGGNTSSAANIVTCGNTTITLNGDPGYISYTWNTGATTTSTSVTDTGTYWVAEVSGCGTQTDTFHVILAPPIIATASSKQQDCGTILNFTCTPSGSIYSYQWAGPAGFTSNLPFPYITNIGPANQGVYTVTVSETGGCSGQATTSVTISPITALVLTNVTPTEIINYGSSVQLNADNALYYWWMPNDGSLSNRNINNPVAYPTQNTVYTVYGRDSSGCLDSAKIIVDIIFDSITIPSAFTPNGDGLNDIFRPIGMKYQKLVEFSVYNRWGQQVFTTNNKAKGWDGTFNGVPQDMDVYDYVLIVELDNGKTSYYKGDVTLLR